MSDPGTRAGAAGQRRTPVFIALIALALAAPLPLGAYADWAWASIAVICGALIAFWGVSTVAGRTAAEAPPGFVWWSAAAMTLGMLWAMLQTAGFMPEGWHHPLWRDTAEALATPYRGAISLDPAESRKSILRIVTYAGVFWLALQYGRDLRRARYALRALAAGSACYALYGLGAAFTGIERVLWFEKSVYHDEVTATFVNPNSFATYAGLGLLCVTAVLRSRFERGAPEAVGLRLRLNYLFAEFMPRNALFLAMWMVLSCALLLSLSRGGVSATALGLLVFFLVLSLRRGVRARALALGAAGLALSGAVLFLLIGQGLERKLWDTGPDWTRRTEIYSQTLTAIEDRPLLGAGLGTFGPVYRSYRTGEIRPGVNMAHNDYLELALELGVPAAVLFVLGCAVLAFGCATGVRARRRNAELPAVGVAACTLVGTHALVDFSLQIPAVAATFSLVLGVSAAQARWPGDSAA